MCRYFDEPTSGVASSHNSSSSLRRHYATDEAPLTDRPSKLCLLRRFCRRCGEFISLLPLFPLILLLLLLLLRVLLRLYSTHASISSDDPLDQIRYSPRSRTAADAPTRHLTVPPLRRRQPSPRCVKFPAAPRGRALQRASHSMHATATATAASATVSATAPTYLAIKSNDDDDDDDDEERSWRPLVVDLHPSKEAGTRTISTGNISTNEIIGSLRARHST